jgi:hypothetical protein
VFGTQCPTINPYISIYKDLLARDRRYALEQVKNAVIAPGVYCLAQFIASIPFNFIAALVFQSIFHWLTNINMPC